MLSRRLLRIKVVKSLYAHFKSESESLIASEKNMLFAIEKTYHLYNQMFDLILEVHKYAEERIEIGRQKMLPTTEDLNPNLKFVENELIKKIADSEGLMRYCESNSLGWSQYPELIKKLYVNLTESAYYKEYMSKPERSYKDDQKLLVDFYTKELEDCELLEDVLLEQSIFWEDDLGFVLMMVIKTLQATKEKDEFTLMPMYRNDDDLAYVKELFRKSLANNKEYLEYIDKFTNNWDVERIAFMDNLIMLATLAELLNFPTIPVKVTLDEFIEISKYYSTPGSSTFINGVLDRIVESLKQENKIEKHGRGLVEES